MKYLIIKVNNQADGTLKKSIYEVEGYDSAMASFHSYLATDIKDKNVLSVFVMVTETNGNVIRNEYWQESPNADEPQTVAEETEVTE